MFSIPYTLDDDDIADLFETALNGYDPVEWRMFHYDGEAYQEYPGQFRKISAGDAYWFNTVISDFEILVTAAKVIRANQTANIQKTLHAGWNQIGNPLPFNIDWNTIAGGNDKIGPLWFFNNGSYSKSGVFKPWTGAFVHVDESITLSIPVLAKTSASGRVADQDEYTNLDAEQWMMPFTLKLDNLKQQSGLGMHPRASTSKDRFDEIAVPRFFDFVEMNTVHDEFFSPKFSTDVVPTADEYVWIFEVNSNIENGQAELLWPHTLISSNESSLILIDILDGKWIDMKTSGRYTFTQQPGRQFKVIFSREGDIR
jgi:hypothetical protein